MFLKPDLILDNIFDIDIDDMRKDGIRLAIFDLDSTVMESGTGHFSPLVLDLLEECRRNFHTVIVSNNKNKKYIYHCQEQTEVPIYGGAKKPNTMVIKSILREVKAQKSEVVVIGDRPLTDILVGKKIGARTILVDSIVKHKEDFATRFVRWLERLTIKK